VVSEEGLSDLLQEAGYANNQQLVLWHKNDKGTFLLKFLLSYWCRLFKKELLEITPAIRKSTASNIYI
jgi:hypothetical protein